MRLTFLTDRSSARLAAAWTRHARELGRTDCGPKVRKGGPDLRGKLIKQLGFSLSVGGVIQNPKQLVEDFVAAAKPMKVPIDVGMILHEAKPAPHRPPRLPDGKCAVYVFSLSTDYGTLCPAGPHRVLKVGKAGPRSQARFQYQHYNWNSTASNLAASLMDSAILWPYLGIRGLDFEKAGWWIQENTDRDHFLLPAAENATLAHLERYVKGRHGPVFEG